MSETDQQETETVTVGQIERLKLRRVAGRMDLGRSASEDMIRTGARKQAWLLACRWRDEQPPAELLKLLSVLDSAQLGTPRARMLACALVRGLCAHIQFEESLGDAAQQEVIVPLLAGRRLSLAGIAGAAGDRGSRLDDQELARRHEARLQELVRCFENGEEDARYALRRASRELQLGHVGDRALVKLLDSEWVTTRVRDEFADHPDLLLIPDDGWLAQRQRLVGVLAEEAVREHVERIGHLSGLERERENARLSWVRSHPEAAAKALIELYGRDAFEHDAVERLGSGISSKRPLDKLGRPDETLWIPPGHEHGKHWQVEVLARGRRLVRQLVISRFEGPWIRERFDELGPFQMLVLTARSSGPSMPSSFPSIDELPDELECAQLAAQEHLLGGRFGILVDEEIRTARLSLDRRRRLARELTLG